MIVKNKTKKNYDDKNLVSGKRSVLIASCFYTGLVAFSMAKIFVANKNDGNAQRNTRGQDQRPEKEWKWKCGHAHSHEMTMC